MKEEFKQFMSAPELTPPQALSEKLCRQIHRDLKVSTPWVLLKLFAIHSLIGAVTLLFCPQFSVGPVGQGMTGTLYALMKIHPLLCAAFCGTVFLGSSALVSTLALRSSELILVKRESWWIYSLLVAISLAFFMAVGSAFEGHYSPRFIAAWSLAAIVSAWGITRVMTWVRLKSWHLMPI